MRITDEQVRTLRAYLHKDLDEALRRNNGLKASGEVPGYAEFIAATFFVAARRHFSPSWSCGEIIRYVADVRRREISGVDLDPVTSETMLLRALGVEDERDLDLEHQMRSQIFLLEAMVLDAQLQPAEIDELLAEARRIARSGSKRSSSDLDTPRDCYRPTRLL